MNATHANGATPAASAPAAIEVRNLSKCFGEFVAVDDLSFQIARGSIVGFLGPNGAGKTTTLRMLLGLVEPTAGTATIDGQPYVQTAEPLRRVGAVLEASGFHPGRSARNHLRLQALLATADERRIDDLLELVDLRGAADRRVGSFSLGMRQRLALATALLPNPDTLILDEPTNGLDPEGVRWLRKLLRDFASRGHTVLVSSHILAEVAHTVDSVLILNHGRLVTHATLDELAAGVQPAIQVRTPAATRLREALAAAHISARMAGHDQVEVTDAPSERIGLIAAEHAIPIFGMRSHEVDLEEVFLQLTGTSAREEMR
jgi:ABC-2 type transport system ATP-binding protein